MIFDTHTHYDDRRFDGDRAAVLAALKTAGIGGIAAVGADLASSKAAAGLAEQDPAFVFAPGVHPDNVLELEEIGEEAARKELSGLLARPKAAALGEIGLDYHGDWPDKPSRLLQEKWFRFQLRLLKEKDLPGIIHSRDAAADTLRIIQEEGGNALSLIMHCYGYEKELARYYLDMGHFLGIGGVVTFKNARKLKETVMYAPLSQLLLETDCPYLAPEPYRGRRNTSLYLPKVIRAIAELKQTDPETVEAVTWENALRFFRLQDDFGKERT
ncbi:MAG: TatD family hydrolase [Lachnospiraceae bacterium]|nr:TatD family hydrolase [Lachnospiraceae bacterium]